MRGPKYVALVIFAVTVMAFAIAHTRAGKLGLERPLIPKLGTTRPWPPWRFFWRIPALLRSTPLLSRKGNDVRSSSGISD
jgi:hypothetical protein